VLDYFVPSDTASPLPLLGDLLPRLPPAVARAYVESYSEPGGIVLDPFCAGVSVIRAAVESGRRAVVASFNPIVMCAVEAALWPVDARAAFTHLADTRKGDRRLADHVLALYAARCPTCGANAIARELVWERSVNAPVFKIVDCHNCGTNGGPADDADVAAARRHEPRGLPFWLLHGKVISPQDEDAHRVSDALDAYSSRALAAIADILLKYEGLSPSDRHALRAPMIGLLDAASLLHPADDSGQPILPRPRPRSLRPAQRFVERNVWLTLESLISNPAPLRFGDLRLYPPQQPILRAPSLETLLESRQPGVCLLVEASRDLSKRLSPRSIDVLLARPPLPDPAFWTLSAVWSAWLWGKHEAAPLLPLLSQRRTNWDWQWRAIASALGSLLPALKDEARVALTFNADDAPGESALDGVALAVAGSGASLTKILCDPFDGYRIHARPVTRRSADRDRESLAQDIRDSASQTAVKTLRARGEPTSWPALRASILEALAARTRGSPLSVVARLPEDGPQPPAFLREAIEAALSAEGAPVVEIESGMWWLVDAGRAGEPLADRVESAVAELLQSKVEWDERELLSEVYRRFPSDLTPERPLVAACIVSYTEEVGRSRVRLRSEDQAGARGTEIQSMQAALAQLGGQLGYAAETRAGQIVWKEDGATAYTLVVSSMATMGAMWLHGQMLAGTPVLVIPGSRATLFQHKLARDARLRQAVARGAWQFLKFSAVRQMIAHAGMDRRAFALALGLDPPLEKPQVQIPLW